MPEDQQDKIVDYLRRVTSDLRRARQRIEELESKNSEPIAIVGMSCRLPGGVSSPEQLWELVASGGDAISGFPTDRGWDLDTLTGKGDRSSTTHDGGFLYDAPQFDADFFGISPREANAMDPQQRLLMEVSWEALERAGIAPTALRGSRTGVFVGAYHWGQASNTADELHGHTLTGTAASVLSGRLAYTMGLEGPAITVDTACSSSLVALHVAAQSLRKGESSLAVVGGVTVLTEPSVFVEFSRQGGLSPDGRCKAFSDAADGTGWSEGVGALVIERLSDARRNGHPVLAVVRGSAVNQDGASNGLTAPHGPSQERVIKQALEDGGLTASDVDVVEAHGTGTRLGDPIEAQALLATYGQDRDAAQPLWLGSLKSNIGHTQAAAGVAGVMKMVMALRHGVLPRTLHAQEPSSHVEWDTGAVKLLGEAVAWPELERPRRAAVSSFGISGTNAHTVLEQAPDFAEDKGETEGDGAEGELIEGELVSSVELVEPVAVPWVVSGRSPAAVRDQAVRLVSRVESEAELRDVDVAHSLLSSRALFEHRAVVVGTDRAELLTGVGELSAGQHSAALASGVADVEGKSVFVFPGQGSQWVGMGARLLEESPVFAARAAECAEALSAFTDWSLLDVLRDAEGAASLERVDVVQPAAFAVMVSLAALWRSHGVEPDAVVGHSQGEIAAAVVSGALSLEDGARVVALRSQAIGRSLAGRGGMMSVALPVGEVEAELGPWEGRVSVAAVNGPRSVVVSGEPEALDALHAELTGREVRARRIAVDYASHSAQVEDLRDELLDVLAPVAPRTGEVPFFSTVTGDWLDTSAMDAEYWVTNLRQRVRFEEAVTALLGQQHRAFVEVSSHPVLTFGIQDMIDGMAEPAVATGTLRRDHGGLARFLLSAAELYVRGVDVDWAPVFTGTGARRVDLPTYAFQHQRFWNSAAPAEQAVTADPADAEFWNAVERQDLDALASTLRTDEDSVAALLPALSSWRDRRREESEADGWRYRVSWKPLGGVAPGRLSGTWLLVAPEGADDTDVATALEAAGAEVRRLVLGADALERSVLASRLTEAGADASAGVLSLLARAEEPCTAYPGLTQGLALSVALVQALGDAEVTAPAWALTQGAFSTGRADPVTRPLHAQIAGVGWTTALEHPSRWGGVVDLPAELDQRAGQRLASVLAGGAEGEDQLAIRASGLFARRIVRAAGGSAPASREWTPRGTTVITGGSGTLAPHLARWLSAQGAEHLVLTSRRGPDAPGAAELVAELAESGTEARIVSCDVTDRDAVASVLRGLKDEGHAIRTVVHTAAAIELETLEATSLEEFAHVVNAKVTGARILDELLEEILDEGELEDFVLYSSTAGMWGSGRHAAYVAGNAYLSALASERRSRGLTAMSLHWGKFPDEIERELADPHQIRRTGLRYLDPDRAMTVLRRALEDDESVLGLIDIDWDTYYPVFTSARPTHLFDEVPEVRQLTAPAAAPEQRDAAGAGGRGELAARLRGLTAAEQERTLLELVRGEAAAVLGHSSAGAFPERRAFRDIGFDSVTAVDLRNRLSSVTGLALPTTMVFDHPSPVALAAFLRSEAVGGDTGAAALPAGAATASGGRDAGEEEDPVVIVGMGCRFPGGVTSAEELWQLVLDEADVISEFPADRGWDARGLYDPDADRHGRTYSTRGGFLHDVADFDPGFFGISPREAVAMDPQQRLLLETAWETFERAGIDPEALRGSSTGTFVGATYQDYAETVANAADNSEVYMATSTAASVLSGRVSYLFGFEGPAVTLDTACSSSLVAMHLACQSLRSGESSLALAGGTAIMATPSAFVGFSRQRALAGDGRCKAFSEDADGMTLAEGVGLVLLERLSDARRNGHEVLAVLRGSAINQDGASNGLTAPNGPSQQRVIRQALASAGLGAGDVDAVEAHGTGTKLGDPIEAQALLATYGEDRDPQSPLLLGSVKSNIGHTQAAAGVAGVIKMAMALRHGVLPRSLHSQNPTSHVDWSSGAVSLLEERTAWPQTERARRAGVSSFGISGTNAHLILEQAPVEEEQAPEPAESAPEAGTVPWLLSARSERALRDQAARLLARTGDERDLPVAATGWSLATTRSAFAHRAVLLGEDREDFARALDAVATGGTTAPGVVRGTAGEGASRPVFVYPGQGSQWWGMGRELLETSEVFRDTVDACAAALAPYIDWSPHDVLAGTGDPALMERVDVVQPALFTMMVALTELWRSYGVEPAAVVGHSQGEIAAAYVAGALSLQDAAVVVALRSQALPQLSGRGGMMSVAAPAARVAELLAPWEEQLSIAAVNGPSSTVVSGDADALDALQAACEEQGVRARKVSVDYASHSKHVEAVREELAKVLAPVAPNSPKVPFYSTVTGGRLESAAFDSEYWYTNLRQTVRMEEATRALLADGHGVFIEVSPHPVLAAAVQETQEAVEEEQAEQGGGAAAVVLGTLRREEGDTRRFLTSLAEAYVSGTDADWSEAFPEGGRLRRVELPTYAFQHQRYWPEPKAAGDGGPTGAGGSQEDAEFWELVEDGDLESLADRLGVGAGGERTSLGEVLPSLSAWRAKSKERSAADALRYRVDWTRLSQPSASRGGSGKWLAVLPSGEAEHPWTAAVLAALGERTVRVETSEKTTRAELSAQLTLLAAEAAAEAGDEAGGEGFTAVVSLLAPVTRRHTSHSSVPGGLAQTLTLVQALADAEFDAPLWCVTGGAVSTGSDDPVTDPVQAAVWGLGLVTALEQPGRWGGLLDLPATPDSRTAASLSAVLAAPGGEDQIAIRPSGVYGRRLVHAETTDVPGAPSRTWSAGGTSLITGGTGGIGGRVARWMAEHGAEHLLLTSRRGPDAPGAAELRAELEELGARVTIAACDAADRGALAALLADIPEETPLTSVFHTAGVSDGDASVDSLTLGQLDALLRSKLTAASHLDELTSESDLDAFVLFSSGAAIWGSGGQPGYAAANAFLDALAAHRRSRGLTGASVSWGTWGEVGMATVAEVHDRLERQGVTAMEPRLAIGAMQRMLEDDDTAVTVTAMDWERFAPSFTAARPSPLLTTIPEAQAALSGPEETAAASDDAALPPLRARLESVQGAERSRVLLEAVRAEAAATLGHEGAEAVPAGRAFRDIGFDSVTAVELRNRLRTATGLPLPAALVFDHPTANALAQHIGTALFGAAPEQEQQAKADDPDARIRDALASVPIGRLRKAGLLEMVLKLADDDGDATAAAAPPSDEAESLDDMDGESLLRLATGNSAN